ncbi:MAG: hypothetical protein HUJ61_03265 [Bacilli bacterium]|nr:hypothetical protein [Bacilli bacterium]
MSIYDFIFHINNLTANSGEGSRLFLFIAIIVAGVGCVAGLILTVILNNRGFKARKIYIELRDKFNKSHASLTNRDEYYLSRLHSMSDTNLVYASLYEELDKNYQELINKYDCAASALLEELASYIKAKEWDEFKKNLNEEKPILDLYFKKVAELDASLKDQFTIEEDLVMRCKEIEEKFDAYKKQFSLIEEDLDIVSETFFQIFDGIEEQFETLHHEIDSAYYDDAGKLLPDVSRMVDELGRALEAYPLLCKEIKQILPEKIESLRNKFNELNSNLPLHHLHVNTSLEEFDTTLKKIYKDISVLEYNGIQSIVEDITKRIDTLMDQFDYEVNCANDVEEYCKQVYDECENIEKRFISLRQKLVKILEVYQLDKNYDNYVEKIQLRVNQMGQTKRQLDTFIHSSTKQPYSILYEKMKELAYACEEVNSMIKEFDDYMSSLKVNADESFALINNAYMNLKTLEKSLRDLNIETMFVRYGETIDYLYKILNELHATLLKSPIDVSCALDLSFKIKEISSKMIDDFKQQYKLARTIEKNLLIANKQRGDVTEAALILQNVENLFLEGNFITADSELSELMRKLNIQ